MKKVVSLFLVLMMVVSVLATFNAAAVITNVADVGKVGDSVNVTEWVNNNNLNEVRKLIIEEYRRGITTRSVKHKGKAYFDYGNSTSEYVHAWVGKKQKEVDGTEFYNSAMNQDFTGGFSDSLATLTQGDNWCCILVTEDSLAKGKAYTVRDGIAKAWGDAGATNSEWGMPTDNQRWIMIDGDPYCYQTFKYGYAIAYQASSAFVEWHRYDEDGYKEPTGGKLDYDWGVSEDQLGDKPSIVVPDPDPVYPDITVVLAEEGDSTDGDQANNTDNSDKDNSNSSKADKTSSSDESLTSGDEADASSDVAANIDSSKVSSQTSGAVTAIGYSFLGMEVGSPAFIGFICGIAALVIIIAVIIIVIVMKKKKKAAGITADDSLMDTPTDDVSTDVSDTDDSDKTDE